jgi:hypothetical protein
MSEPEQPERDAYDDQEFGGPERMSVEQRDRLVELEAQNDLMQQRADAEDLADQLLEEATHHAAENPDNAAALVSIADELRAARIYLEQRTERAEHHEEPTSGPDAAQLAEEQQHRESARVLSEREQPQQERGIER